MTEPWCSKVSKVKVKFRYLKERYHGWRDFRDLRALNRVVHPRDYSWLSFASPTRSLKTKMLRGPDREEETRKWIESIPQNGSATLWDVGANVGSFTIFAASRGLQVVAFEPMPHNILLLTRNVIVNELQNRVVVVPMAVTRRTMIASLGLSSFDFGSAGHGFGTDRMSRGGIKQVAVARFQTVGLSIDAMVSAFELSPPTHLKVDVDGIDDEIIYGSSTVLAGIQSICCEIKLEHNRLQNLISFLKDSGFEMKYRTRRNGFFYRV